MFFQEFTFLDPDALLHISLKEARWLKHTLHKFLKGLAKLQRNVNQTFICFCLNEVKRLNHCSWLLGDVG